MSDGGIELGSVRPTPSPEELAAITAALQVLSVRAVVVGPPDEPSRWRFSGRWWSKPLPSRRERP